MMRQCASESNLVVFARQAEQREEYKRKLRQSPSFKRLELQSEKQVESEKQLGKIKVKSSIITAALFLALAWSLGLHIHKEDKFQKAVDSLDSICPKLTRVDNTTITLKEFDFRQFQGDWHKVAWLREPDKDDMRCRFVTSSEEAKNIQHLEQISPANFPDKGYHFLLNRVSKLWVVDTDYENWAMLYTCSPHFGTTTQQAFIVSRKKTLDIMTMGEVLNKWSEYNVPWKDFTIKEQQHQCA